MMERSLKKKNLTDKLADAADRRARDGHVALPRGPGSAAPLSELLFFLLKICLHIKNIVCFLSQFPSGGAFIQCGLEMLDVPFDRTASRHVRT